MGRYGWLKRLALYGQERGGMGLHRNDRTLRALEPCMGAVREESILKCVSCDPISIFSISFAMSLL
jgi:hypothetical protein